MTNLFSKIWTQASGFFHDALDRFSDVGRTGRQAVRELDEQIGQAEESVTSVAAELLLMQNNGSKAVTAAEKWGTVAKMAADKGDSAAAIEAVQQQVQSEELAQSFDTHVARLAPMLEQLKARLVSLRQRKQEMQHKTSILDARSKIADAESRAARLLGNVGVTPGVDFSQLEENVDRKEAKAAALAQMAHQKAELDIDQRLADYSRCDAIALKLQALGLNPVQPAMSQGMIAKGATNG